MSAGGRFVSHVLYRIEPTELLGVLTGIVTATRRILTAAPVDETGKYLDNGTWSTGTAALGIPISVVHLDAHSLDSLESDLTFALEGVLDEPALKLADSWYVTHDTSTHLARLIDQLNEIHRRVGAVAPGLDVTTPQSLGGTVNGSIVLPETLQNSAADHWQEADLSGALTRLAALNYASHRREGHGKSWEPGFGIVHRGDQWTITFSSYQFDDPFSGSS